MIPPFRKDKWKQMGKIHEAFALDQNDLIRLRKNLEKYPIPL